MAISKTFSSYDYVGKDGRYLTLTVTETSVNTSNNTSNISWTLSTNGGAVTYYDTFCLVKINGQQVYFSNGMFSAGGYSGWIGSRNHPIDTDVWVDANGNENTCAKWGFSTSGTISGIAHNNNGTKSITVSFLVGCFYYVVKDCGGSITLSTIDRTPPVVTQHQPSNITYNSCRISASSDVTCSKWWYRKREVGGNWENWIEINSSIDHLDTTVTGLSPNTSYEFEWCGRSASNGIDGYSTTKTVKTLGASILNDVSDIYLDTNSPVFTYDITTYSNTFYHQLVLTNTNLNNDNIITINIGTKDSGSFTHTFTSSQISLLRTWLGTNSYTLSGITAILKTYTNSAYTTQIGSSSDTFDLSLIIREQNAIPTLTVSGYEDTNSNSKAITGNKYYIIPNSSILRIKGINASAKYGAIISSLTVTSVNQGITQIINVNTGSSNSFISYSGNYTWGKVTDEIGSYFEITLTDSRGKVVIVPLSIQIYRKGALIKASDYNNWYDILFDHYNAKDYNGEYYISGSSYSSGFIMPPRKNGGELVEATDIDSLDYGMARCVDNIPHSNVNDYYYSVANNINHLYGICTGISLEDLIEANTKTEIDSDLAAIDNIVLFNLVKGE